MKQNFFKKWFCIVDKKPGKLKGFTLVELLLAMVITSILVLGMNAMFRNAKLIYSKTETERPIYQKARILSETLRNDLAHLYFPPETEAAFSNSLGLTPRPNNGLELVFFTLVPSFQTNPLSCRIAKVRYEFVGMGENTERGVLRRFERSYATEKELGPPHSDIVASDLTKFEVFALDSTANPRLNKWKNSYTSKEVPPKALKVSFAWQLETDSPPVEFDTIFAIPCQESLASLE